MAPGSMMYMAKGMIGRVLRDRTRPSVWWAGFLVLLAALPARSSAAEDGGASAWVSTDQTEVRLISAVAAVGDRDSLPLGLQFRLRPGWKTYWRSPGDAGLPVTVAWDGSANVASVRLHWPVPRRFTLFGLDTFGYGDEVVFPVTVAPERPGEPVRVNASVDYLVCATICIPYQAALSLELPAGPAAPTGQVQLIDRYRAQVPGDGAAHGLSLERAALADDGTVLEVEARSAVPFGAPDLIVEAPPGLHFAAPETTLSEARHVAVLRLPIGVGEGAPPLVGTPVTLTLFDDQRGLERVVTLAAGAGQARGLRTVLALALLGGLILNLMPCVLPVLSLKLLRVVGHGGAAKGAVRASFLASAAGVVSSLLVLGAALAGLKAGGLAIGWGVQFQQPAFLIAMVLLLTLFACNLWGWFEVPLPGWLGGLAAGGRRGLAGDFVAGLLVTLLATPCSAPFVGTAVGFALARGPGDIMAVFFALALGLAMPYLAIAAVPGLATWLPRPGRWMTVLRGLLGLALAGTAVWLLSVLAALLDPPTAAFIGALMLGAGAALWARRRLPASLRLASPAAVGMLALAAFLAPAGVGRLAAPPTTSADAVALWQSFDLPRIAALVGAGKLVLVDVSADWCITCQLNKALVLNSPEVAGRLAGPDVVAMRADWTRPSEEIARYLASFGRYGIPFNAVYGPQAPSGIALPELLSKDAVFAALARAGG